MPIHVLKVERTSEGTSFDNIFRWCDEYVRSKDYVILKTDEHEIILEPRKSTRPVDYGYVKLRDSIETDKLAEELSNRYKLKVLEIQALAWDIEKSPWVKIPVE